jgi:hypothetical protein
VQTHEEKLITHMDFFHNMINITYPTPTPP